MASINLINRLELSAQSSQRPSPDANISNGVRSGMNNTNLAITEGDVPFRAPGQLLPTQSNVGGESGIDISNQLWADIVKHVPTSASVQFPVQQIPFIDSTNEVVSEMMTSSWQGRQLESGQLMRGTMHEDVRDETSPEMTSRDPVQEQGCCVMIVSENLSSISATNFSRSEADGGHSTVELSLKQPSISQCPASSNVLCLRTTDHANSEPEAPQSTSEQVMNKNNQNNGIKAQMSSSVLTGRKQIKPKLASNQLQKTSTHGVHPPESEQISKNHTIPPTLPGNVKKSRKCIHTCDVCGQKFASKFNFKNHLSIHVDVWKVKCIKCDKRFTHTKYLKSHICGQDSGETFECDICFATCKSAKKLRDHLREKHDKGRHKCKICSRFYEIGDYEKHAELHNDGDIKNRERTFRCKICDYKYCTRYELEIHRKTHTEEKPHLCSVCGMTFRSISSFRTHSQRHSEKYQNDKIHKKPCRICKKEYSRLSLYQHEMTHRLTRTFMCDKCGRAFFMKHHLLTHQKSHLDERPHVCEICSQSFRLAHHLRAHKKTHGKVVEGDE